MIEPTVHLPDGRPMHLPEGITPVGRAPDMGVRLVDPTVSPLHAELVRRGLYVYVTDLGLSRNGTRVNGRPIAQRVLNDGDQVMFANAACWISAPRVDEPVEPVSATSRDRELLQIMCSPLANSVQAFTEPLNAVAIAHRTGLAHDTVRKHFRRLEERLGVRGDVAIANEAVHRGLVQQLRCGHGTPEPPGAHSGEIRGEEAVG